MDQWLLLSLLWLLVMHRFNKTASPKKHLNMLSWEKYHKSYGRCLLDTWLSRSCRFLNINTSSAWSDVSLWKTQPDNFTETCHLNFVTSGKCIVISSPGDPLTSWMTCVDIRVLYILSSRCLVCCLRFGYSLLITNPWADGTELQQASLEPSCLQSLAAGHTWSHPVSSFFAVCGLLWWSDVLHIVYYSALL